MGCGAAQKKEHNVAQTESAIKQDWLCVERAKGPTCASSKKGVLSGLAAPAIRQYSPRSSGSAVPRRTTAAGTGGLGAANFLFCRQYKIIEQQLLPRTRPSCRVSRV